MLAGVALRYLQVAYTGMQKSLQQECDFIQRITEGVGKEFQLVEDELCRDLITALFHRMEKHMPGWDVTQIPVKQAGLAFTDTTLYTPKNRAEYCTVDGHLVAALQ